MKRLIVALILALVLAGCAGPVTPEIVYVPMDEPIIEEPEPVAPDPDPEPANRAPTVTVADLSVIVGRPVTLTADGYDPDGDQLTYQWTGVLQAVGQTVEWTPGAIGEYELSVTVSDGDLSAEAASTVTVEPEPWQPEILHVYIFDCTDAIAYDTECTEATYGSTLSSYRLAVELWNRDEKDGSPFYIVGGGLP